MPLLVLSRLRFADVGDSGGVAKVRAGNRTWIFGCILLGHGVSKSLVTTTDPELDNFAAVALALRQVLLALFCQLQTRKPQQRFWVKD